MSYTLATVFVIPNCPISAEHLQFLSSEHWKVVFFIFKHDEKETNETHKEYYSGKKREHTVLNILITLVVFFK